MNQDVLKTPTEPDDVRPTEEGRLEVFEVGYRLAASALWRDRFFLIIPIVILAIPDMLRGTRSQPWSVSGFILNVLELVVETGFLYFIAVHLVQRFCETALPLSLETFKRLLIYTFAGRLALMIPTLLFTVQLADSGSSGLEPLWFLLGAGIFAAVYAFFFYFMPIILGSKAPKNILSEAYAFLSVSRTLPIRVVFYPWVLFFLCVGLASALDPQFQSTFVLLLLSLGYGAHRLLLIYLAISCALVVGNSMKKVVLSIGSIPQPSEQLAKHVPPQWSAPSWLIAAFSSRTSGLLLAGALLLLGVGTFRLQAAPLQSEVVNIESVIKDQKIEVVVHLEPRGESPGTITPLFFSLKTGKGALVSNGPEDVLEVKDGKEVKRDGRLPLPVTKPSVLKFEFTTDRTREQTQKLNDLFLWYQDRRLKEILITDAPEGETNEPVGGEAI